MKKIVSFILCCALMFCVFPTISLAENENKSKYDLNIVIVMDDSGTLNRTDADKKCVQGAKLFVDLLPMTNSRVGLVVFGGGVKTVALQSINNASTREAFKDTIASKVNYNEHLTDIGEALEAAMNMLGAENKENSAILLFTDGVLSLAKSGGENSDYNQSLRRIDAAVATAQSKEWPIFTIGLDDNGKADKDRLEYISQNTGAGDPLIAENANQMAEYFTDIFKRYMDINAPTQRQEITTGTAVITQPLIASETNILLTGGSISNITLEDPDGNLVNLNNGSQIYMTQERDYTLIKLLLPAPGEWKVHAEGREGQTLYVQTLDTYDLPLSTEISATSVQKNQTITFDSYLVYNNGRVTMPSFYEQTSAVIELVDTESNRVAKYDMEVLDDGYTLTLPMTDGGSFKARIIVTTPNFIRESDVYDILVENMPVEPVDKIPDVAMHVGEEQQIDLSQYFKDPYGDKLAYSFQSEGGDLATFNMDGDTLTVVSNGAEGQCEVTVTADDGDDSTAQQSIELSVMNIPVKTGKAFASGTVFIGGSISYDMNDLFTDPDGLPLKFDVSVEGDSCEYTINGSVLTFEGKKTGAMAVTIVATDSAGSSASQKATVSSYTLFGYYAAITWPYLAGLIALLIIILLIRHFFTKIRGVMKVAMSTEDESGPHNYDEYQFTPTRLRIGKCNVKGKQFALNELMTKYSSYLYANYGELDLPVVGQFSSVRFRGVVFGYKAKISVVPKNASIEMEVNGEPVKASAAILKPGQKAVLKTKVNTMAVMVTVDYNG